MVIALPYKPKRPCRFPGCPALTDKRFCEIHTKQDSREYERHHRDPATYKRYGKEWRKIRNRYIAANPLCELCKQEGRFTPAQEVHHIVPLSDGGTHEWSNLQALCTPCHSALHLRERNLKS